VYQVSDASSVLCAHRRLLASGAAGPRVSRTVLLLGLTSLFTDISSEMVVTVLPLYLVHVGQFSPVAFGFVDGLQRGAAALVGLASGFAGDRFRRHKEVAATGYGLSAVVKLGLATAGTALSTIGALVVVDRIGKGIRTAPRDAMISLSTPEKDLGAAFGVHRALDTTGALLGPVVAFGLLMWTQTSFDGVFFVSFCFALVGLAVLLLFVQNPRPEPRLAEVVEAPQGNRLRLLAERRFLGLGLAGALLGVATMSDGFVYLGLQQKLDFEPGMFPLLFVATASVFMLLAVPMGQLADRVGRTKVFLGGYCLLLPVYGLLLATDVGLAAVVLATVLLGTFYAATDGVLAAMASTLLPEEVRGTGLAALVTATSTGRMLASILFGALWTAFGYEAAVAAFVVVLLSALATATPVLVRMQRRASNA
jgi:MFS family permease